MESPRKSSISLIYVASFLAGCALVTIPASSTMMKDGLGLSDGQYGFLFVPQLVGAIAGSFFCSLCVKRLGLKIILQLSLFAFVVSEGLFGSLPKLQPLFPLACVSTSILGLGLGLMAAPMNIYPGVFFPTRKEAALVAAHSAAGVGLMLGPIIAALLMQHGAWSFFSFGLTGLGVLLLGWSFFAVLSKHAPAAQVVAVGRPSVLKKPLFWVFVGIVVAYAFAEGVFHNWGILYLKEEKLVDPRWAALALTIFWGAITVGRAVSSALLFRLSAWSFWLTLPLVLIFCYAILGCIHGPRSGLAIFALAGAGCSAFFPLTLSLAGRAFPEDVERVTALLIGFVIAGGGFCAYGYGALRSVVSLDLLFRASIVHPILMLALVWIAKRNVRQG